MGNRLALDATRYYTQISPFIDTFGRDSVLLLDFSEFVQDQASALRKLERLVDPVTLSPGSSDPVHANAWPAQAQHALTVPGRLPGRLGLRRLLRRSAGARRRIPHPPQPSDTQLRPELQRAILRMLALEIDALERVMDRDLSSWRLAGSTA